MSKVRIVGGGLSGILAAFQAHKLGVRDIELHERFDRLGGVTLPEERGGLELRASRLYFGPQGDPIRELLESYGPTFQDIENTFGSVSAGPDGKPIYTEDFGGPALPCLGIGLAPPKGPSLADRLASYPSELKRPLTRYVRWSLGQDPRALHESAARALAIHRVYPIGANLIALADAKQTDPLADDLYAIPRGLWGRTENAAASLPAGGFVPFIKRCRLALEAIGVRIHDESLIAPRQAITEHRPGDVLVWACSPTPLFKAAGAPNPRLSPKSFATYIFACGWTGPKPFYVQNFTAEGVCFRVHLYESAGRTLLSAECVAEGEHSDLRYEIHRLLHGFEGDLALGEHLHTSIKPRWTCHTVETIQALTDLRARLAKAVGPGFVAGGWEAASETERFAQVNAGLAAALAAPTQRAVAA